ncbi:MAG TPA: hypothetical protein VGU22_16700 [Methylomirabilota bacterium]|jgi:hypothetical protein|nr:hypothetical protein [Methylomirabilota bacterium]
MTDTKKGDEAKRKGPAPAAEDVLDTADRERRAERSAPERGGRPLHREETAPGERGDAPYGDSERGDRRARPGTTPGRP